MSAEDGLFASLAFAAPSPAAISSPSECDLVAAQTGSDSAAGTEAAPLRTSDAAVQRLAAGQTLCFRSGTYSTTRGLRMRRPFNSPPLASICANCR